MNRNEIEQSADTDQQPCIELRGMRRNPLLLERIAQRNQQYVRPTGVHLRDEVVSAPRRVTVGEPGHGNMAAIAEVSRHLADHIAG